MEKWTMAEASSNSTNFGGCQSSEEQKVSTECAIDAAYIHYVKLAVAMAIIRGKPQGLSGRQYAERLCGTYMTSQLRWEERARHLEEEVILLTQKCVQRELAQHTSPQPTGEKDNPVTSCVRCADSSGVRDKPLVTQDEKCSARVTSDKSALRLAQHTSFLRSVLTLKSLDGCPGIDRKEIEHITMATAKSAIKTVEGWLRDKTKHWMLSDEMVDSVLSLLCQLACQPLSKVLHGAIVQSGTSLVQSLLTALMDDKDLGNDLEQSRLTSMVETLAKCPHLRLSVVQLLVDWVTHFSDTLRSQAGKDKVVVGDDQDFHPGSYENIGRILSTLEVIINSEIHLPRPKTSGENSNKQLDGSSIRQFTEEFCTRIYHQLDRSLLNLSSQFPLFAHGVWRLEGLVDMLRIKRNW